MPDYKPQTEADIKGINNSVVSFDNLRLYINQTNDLIIVLREQTIIFSNSAVEKLFGYSKSEIIGKSSLEFISDDAKEEAIERYNKRMAGEELSPLYESEVVCKDGSIKPIEISTRPFELEGQKVLILIIRDITDRKQAEEVLHQYEHIVSSSTDMLALLDKRYNYLAANKAYIKAFKLAPEQLIGNTAAKVFGEEFFNTVIKPNADRCLGGEEVNYQDWFDFPAFGRVYMDITYYPYYSDNNMIAGFVVDGRNITDRKLAENALSQSEERYRLLFDNAEESIFLVDEDGVFRMMNNRAAEYLGGKPEDFVGKNMMDLFPPVIARRQMKSIKTVLKSNRGGIIQNKTVINNMEKTFRTSIIPAADIFGSKKTVQLIAHDITESQQMQLRDKTRLQLNELLRDAKGIDQCLTLGCQAIFGAELFKRSVFSLHNKERQITNIGYVGIGKKMAERAKKAPPPSMEMAKKMMQDKYKISNSFFIPAEAGLYLDSSARYIPQKSNSLQLTEAWTNGDELFVPIFRAKKEIAGWLSVDTPFNKLRPNIEIIQFLEQIADIVYFKIRDLLNVKQIEAEGIALKEKNIALKEVLGYIEEEKIAMRKEVTGQIEQTILPAIDKAINKKGDLKKSFIDIARTHLLQLATFSTGSTRMYSRLSRRESEVCQLIKAGNTNKEIAGLLAISISTVQKHRESIRRKFGLKNKSENLAVFLQ